MITCFFEDSDKKVYLRHVTTTGIIVQDNKILLVKRAPWMSNGNKYGLPGGFADRDETIHQAICRETLEETGYEVKSETLFRINDNPNRGGEDRQNVEFIFLVTVGEKIGGEDKESTEVRWFDLNNLPKSKEFAFDHYDNIRLYRKYRDSVLSLPLFG